MAGLSEDFLLLYPVVVALYVSACLNNVHVTDYGWWGEVMKNQTACICVVIDLWKSKFLNTILMDYKSLLGTYYNVSCSGVILVQLLSLLNGLHLNSASLLEHSSIASLTRTVTLV